MQKNMMAMGLAVLAAGIVSGQGSLTPPGAPAATMKTLDQVEARTPISAAGFSITESGSYYLTRNLEMSGAQNGISVAANNVTIDLNGFTINGVDGNRAGISIGTYSNVKVMNGKFTHCYRGAVYAENAEECSFEDLQVSYSAQGQLFPAIIGGPKTTVRDCQIMGCKYNALEVSSGSTVEGTRICENEGSGITVSGTGSRIEGNDIRDNTGAGLEVTGQKNLVKRNQVIGNGDNYDFVAGNQLNLLLCEIPETLDWPCSVMVAGSLECSPTNVNGITVNADNITIDLGGHALIGPGEESGSGIRQHYDRKDLRVCNGSVCGWGGAPGLDTLGEGTIISGINASTNYIGIKTYLGEAVIENCTCAHNYRGIWGGDSTVIRNVVATHNDEAGVVAHGTLIGCVSSENGGNGIQGSGVTIVDCTAVGNGEDGISVNTGGVISGCTISGNSGNGVEIAAGCYVHDCMIRNNGLYVTSGTGIYVWSDGSRIDNNHLGSNRVGVKIISSGNVVTRNTARGNFLNYDIAAGNQVGSITNTFVGAGPWDNFDF